MTPGAVFPAPTTGERQERDLNGRQKLAFFIGILIIVLMGLFPPWKESGKGGKPLSYAPVFAPPRLSDSDRSAVPDLVRLFLQVGAVFMLSGGVVAVAAPTPARKDLESPSNKVDAPPGDGSVEKASDANEGSGRREGEDAREPNKLRDNELPGVAFELPDGRSYGILLVESDDEPDYWEYFGEAKGAVVLPRGKRIQLEVKGDDSVDLSFVSVLPSDCFYSVDLSESLVKDWELANLKKLEDLRELDLSDTAISSEAVKFIRGLNKLERLWLDGTGVDDSCLDDLRRLDALRKLSLKGSKVTASGAAKLVAHLENCEIEH